MTNTPYVRLAALAAALAAMACGGGGESKPAAQPEAAPAAAPAVKPTGKVIVIEMISDEKGNRFVPNKIEAHLGDVLRFTVKIGVHNVHFLPDSNPGKKNLPPPSDFLQIPGQTWDYVVALEKGHYYFQCDPHALLGMTARLEVEDEH